MFESVRKHAKIIQFVLLLLIVPAFVLVGVEQGYSSFRGSKDELANVDGRPISRAEYDNELRSQEDFVRRRAQGQNVDPQMFETPEFRQQAFDILVRRHVLAASVDKLGLYVPNSRLQRLFQADPQLAGIRNENGGVSKEFLASRGMSSEAFAEELRRDYGSRQVLAGVLGSTLASSAASNVALDAVLQRREVQTARFMAQSYLAQAQPTDADLKKFYEDAANAKRFEAPEQVSVEYVQLDLAALKAGITIGDDEARKFYDTHLDRFIKQPEERRASHILIKVDAAATPAQRDAARAQAQALLEQARKNPSGFAALAKQHSQDEVSAAKGGDLDFFPRKAMVPAFEEAAFALKEGQVSDLVTTEYGFHIIQLTGIHPEVKQSFEDARAAIVDELKTEQAKRAYVQAAEQFTNTVFEQSDSLKPVADQLKLPVRTATLTRPAQGGLPPELAAPKLLHAVFDPTNIKLKRNTEATDVGDNKLVSARVLQHQPARKRPFAEVEAFVRGAWIAQRTAELAKQDAQRQMEAWKKDASKAALSEPAMINRTPTSPDLVDLIRPVMHAPADKLPAWLLVDLGGQGTAVVRVNKVLPPDIPAKDREAAQGQYSQLWGAAEAQAYFDALKKRLKVESTPAAAAAIGGASGAQSTH